MIEDLRKEISKLDRQISDLLCQRFSLVEKIQTEKDKLKKPIEDLPREAEVLNLVKQGAPEKFHLALESIYQSIFSAGKRRP